MARMSKEAMGRERIGLDHLRIRCCPRCGGTASAVGRTLSREQMIESGKHAKDQVRGYYRVQCDCCDYRTPEEDAVEQAIELWNEESRLSIVPFKPMRLAA